MRAAAVALVLIVGAAVVLWYGNTLNSWVLGGLIGGLAALLISIPISLLLFSYLARRHDERTKAEAQEEMSLAVLGSYNRLAPPVEIYESDAYMLPSLSEEDEEDWNDAVDNYRTARGRNLPVPSSQRLPAARQSQLLPAENGQYRQQNDVTPVRKGQTGPTPRPHPKTGQLMRYPGFPGYHVNSQSSAHRTAALRAARQEATQQYDDSDTQVFPTSPSKRIPAVRPDQRIVAQQSVQPHVPRQARQMQSQPQPPQHYRHQRTVEGSSVPGAGNRSLPRAGEGTTGPLPAGRYARPREVQTDKIGERYARPREAQTDKIGERYARPREAQTDKIGERYAQTGPVRRQTTDHLGRNPQVDGQRRNPDVISGSLKNPLVRRAPYMYEDDPLRQELAQHIEVPRIRRSSRYEEYDEEG